MFSSAHFGAFDVGDRNESINDYDNDSLTLKQTYSYDYIGCDDQFVEKYQSLKKQLDYIDKYKDLLVLANESFYFRVFKYFEESNFRV